MTGFRGKKFEIDVLSSVAARELCWPTSQERRSETLGGNRSYCALSGIKWSEIPDLVGQERAVISRLAEAADWEACYAEWCDECEDESLLLGFDLGTNALSGSLCAARCIPFYGCNGGALGGDHHDAYPLVAFFCRPAIFPFVESAASASGAGLENNHAGGINAFGRDVDALIDMAEELWKLRAQISAVRIRTENTRPSRKSRAAISSSWKVSLPRSYRRWRCPLRRVQRTGADNLCRSPMSPGGRASWAGRATGPSRRCRGLRLPRLRPGSWSF